MKNQKEYIGFGKIGSLGDILQDQGPGKVFLVTGKGSYENSPAKAVVDGLSDTYDFVRFSDFEVNPKLTDIEKGINIFMEENCDMVVAIGGGSAIDVAKAVNSLAFQRGKPEEYVTGQKKIETPGKYFVAVPTTSGTGSEATHFAVVYIGKTKYSLGHKEYMLPDSVILDPGLTMSLPASVTAASGMDALCQGIEAHWSVNATSESRKFSSQAILLAYEHLRNAVNSPTKEARYGMMRAANFGGKAINLAKTTASHSVSYPITSNFGVAHGHAVGLTIPGFLEFNYGVTADDIQEKLGPGKVDNVKESVMQIAKLIGANTPSEAGANLTQLMQDIGLKTRLSELGVDDAGVELIIRNGFNPQRVINNPRKLTEEQLRCMLIEIL